MGSKPGGVPGAAFSNAWYGDTALGPWARVLLPLPTCQALCRSLPACIFSVKPPVPLQDRYLLSPFADTEGLCHAHAYVLQSLTGLAGIKGEKRTSGNKKSKHWEDMFMKERRRLRTHLLNRTYTTRNAKITKNSLLNLILQCNHLFIIYLTAIY